MKKKNNTKRVIRDTYVTCQSRLTQYGLAGQRDSMQDRQTERLTDRQTKGKWFICISMRNSHVTYKLGTFN